MRFDLSGNAREVVNGIAQLHPQFNFAAAKALTDTVRAVQAAMPGIVDSVFAGGAVDFTKRGFYTQSARKDNLQASIGVKDKQAEYMQYQVEGGTRSPKRQALRLPSVVQLTTQGNLPAGTIARLIAAARSGRRVKGATARKLGIANSSEIFYGQPKGRPDLPVGLYSRRNSSGHRSLVPIVVFPKRSARYTERRFDFYGECERRVQREFEPALARAWAYALATAK